MKSALKNSPARQSGYSLLEVLVTLTLVVMLSVTAVPTMTGLIANSRQTAGTTELLIALNAARSEALKRHQHVTVCKSDDGESCGNADVSWQDGWIVFANSSSATVAQREDGEELLHVSATPGGSVVIEPNAAVADFIAFRPNGRSAVEGFFTWCDSRGADKARGLMILPSGYAEVSKTKSNGDPLSCSGGS